MSMPTAASTYTCPYCRMASDGDGGTCPRCGAPIDIRLRVVELRVGQAAADPGHGPDQVQPVHLPDQRHVRAGRRDEPATTRTGSTSPTTCCCTPTRRSRLESMKMAGGWNRMMAGMPLIMMSARGPGLHRVQRGPPGRDPGDPAAARTRPSTWSSTASCSPPATSATSGSQSGVWFTTQNGDDTETHYPLGRFIDRFMRAGRPRPAAAARARATRSSATWRPASASWSSRAG